LNPVRAILRAHVLDDTDVRQRPDSGRADRHARMDNITILDLRVEKEFRLGQGPPHRGIRRCVQPVQRQSGAEH
jgi:hypothetical protein